MSRLLLAVTLLCLAVCANAQAGNFIKNSYTTSDCSGTATVLQNTAYTFATTCNLQADGTSWAYYITGGTPASVTQVKFTDIICQVAYKSTGSFFFSVPGAFGTLNACTQTITGSWSWTLSGAASSIPSLTASGNGVVSSVAYYNSTTYASNTVCPVPSSGVITLPSSYTTGVCLPYGTSATVSQIAICLAGGQFAGTAYYSGGYSAAGTCTTAANFQYAEVLETTPLEVACSGGQPSSCVGASSVPGLSVTGPAVVTYPTDSTCTNADGAAKVQFYPSLGGCSSIQAGSSNTYACSVNNTSGATLATYTSYNTATCTGTPTVTSWPASATAYSTPASATSLASYCHAQHDGSYYAVTCDFWSAAPSVSVSVVALLAAALLSLLATKNL